MVAIGLLARGKVPTMSRPAVAAPRSSRKGSMQVEAQLFRFGGKKADTGGMVGGMTRDEFTRDEVEQYFNYMGMLAVSGDYGPFDKMMNSGLHPCDILLLWAAQEGDDPKVEELLSSGADVNVKHPDSGKTPLEIATKPAVIDLLKNAS